MEDRLSQEKHDAILEEIKKAKLKAGSRDNPRAILLAGQPGAGKSYVREEAKAHLNSDGKGVVVIDPDDLRAYHPRYAKHALNDSRTSAEKVHHDASLWAKELRAEATEQKMNMVVDGTLSNSKRADELCRDLKNNGYNIEVRALAVDKQTSLESIEKRYQDAVTRSSQGKHEIPRYVSKEFHDHAYKEMPDTVNHLEKNKLTDGIRVVDREGNQLYSSNNRTYSENSNAKSAIDKGREEMSKRREAPMSEGREAPAAGKKIEASVSKQTRDASVSVRNNEAPAARQNREAQSSGRMREAFSASQSRASGRHGAQSRE